MADSGIAKIADTLRNQNSGGFRMAQPAQPPVQNITVVQQGSQSVQTGTTDGDKQIVRALTDIYSILQTQLNFERQAHQEDNLKQALVPKEFQTEMDSSAIRESKALSSIDENIKKLLDKDFRGSSSGLGDVAGAAAGMMGLGKALKSIIPILGTFGTVLAGYSGVSGGFAGSVAAGALRGGIPGAIVGGLGWAGGRIAGRKKDSDPRLGKWDDVGKPGSKIRTSVDDGTKVLLDRITQGEGTSDERAKKSGFESGYDVPYGFGKYGKPEKPLSQMTVGEVKEFQKKQIAATRGKIPGTNQGTGAVGKYQVVQGTLAAQQKKLGFSDEDKFTPELQDKIGRSLLEGRGYSKFRSGEISGKKFQSNLSQEWASIADPNTGRSRYGQSTGTSSEQISQAIAFSKEHREEQPKEQQPKEGESVTRLATAAEAENTNSEPSTWSKLKTWATKPLWGDGSEEPVKTATKESQVPEGGKYAEEESEMEESNEPILTEDGQAQKLTKESSDGGYNDYFQQMVSLLSTIAEKVGGDKKEENTEEEDEEEETSETAQREDGTQQEPQLTAKKESSATQQQASPNLVNLGVTPMTQQSMNPMGALQGVLSTAQQGMMMGQMFGGMGGGGMGGGGMGGIGGAMSGIGMAGSAIGSAGSILGALGQTSPMLSGAGNPMGSIMGTLGSTSGIMSGIQGIQNMGRGGMGGGMGVTQGILGMGQSVLGSVQGLGQGIGNAFGGLFGPTQSKVGTIVDGKPVYGENQINKSMSTKPVEEVSPNKNKVGQSLNIDAQVKQISEIDRKMNDPNQPIDTRSDQQRVTEGIDAVSKAEQEIKANQNKVGQSLTSSPNVSSLGAGSDSSAINAKYSMVQETPSTGAKLEGLTTTVASAKEERMVPQESQPTIINNGGGGQSQPAGAGSGTPTPDGVMGIDIGVRTDEPTLLRAQYGSIRTV